MYNHMNGRRFKNISYFILTAEDLVKKTFPNYKYEFLKDYNKLYRMLFIYKN